jgi:hypothetical protein
MKTNIKIKFLSLLFFLIISQSYGQINYSFNFDANATGWTGNFSRFTGGTACGGAGGAMRRNMYSTANTTGQLISPNTGNSNGQLAIVSYTYKAAVWSANTVVAPTPWGTFDVQYGATATGPWTTFATVTNETQLGNACISKSHSVVLPAGNTFIRFSATWQGGDYWLNFDNISVVQESTTPPNCIISPSAPTNAATNVSLTQLLTWATAAGASGYDVYFGTSSNPPLVSSNQVGLTYNPGILSPSTLYYWQIVPRNSNGSSSGCAVWSFTTGLAGCLNVPNGLWPTATFTPTCNGLPQAITTAAWTGEYSNVNLTSGTEYIFSSSVATDYITISNATGTTILASGQTPLTWTSNVTGTVRFISHNNIGCLFENVNRSRLIQCGTSCNTTASTLAINTTSTVVNDVVTLSLSGGNGNPTAYQFSFNNFTTIEGTINSTANPLNLLVNVQQTQIWFRAVTQAPGCLTALTNIVSATFDCATPITNGTSGGDFITNVTFNTINNNSTRDLFSDAYQNFTNLSTTVCQGSSYTLNVSGTNTFGSNQGFSAWIDWNGDGVFQTTEQVLTSAPTPTANANVTVPMNSFVGSVKMRVACRWNGTPNANACDPTAYGYGEIEEYTINIQGASIPPISISNTGTYCHGNEVTLSVNGGTLASGSSWEWFTTSCGGTAAGNGNNITVSPASTTQYFVRASANGACPATVCVNGTITLPTAGTNLSTNGESATCVVNGSNFIRFYAPSGNLILAINPNGEDLGNVTVTSYVGAPGTMFACDNPGNTFYETAYMGRSWIITSENAPTNPVSVQYPFSNGELNALETLSLTTLDNLTDDVDDRDDLVLTKFTADNPAEENATPTDNCTVNGVTRVLNQASNGANPYGLTNAQYVIFNLSEFSENFLHGSTGPSALPVELTSFSATCNADFVQLNWTTGSELNSDKFIIESSRDLSTWNILGEVKSAGNSSQVTHYQFVDEFTSGLTYYRLRQVDFDGKVELLPTISASCNSSTFEVSLHPNPTNGLFTVLVQSEEMIKNAEIVLVDLTGKIIQRNIIDIQKGQNEFYQDASHLNAGSYLLYFNIDNNDFTPLRVVKVN